MNTTQRLEKKILDISYRNKLSHIGSCLTALPIIEEIYKIKKPEEKFILSCGHAHLAHAVVMEEYGIIKSAEENIEKYGIHCERAGGCDCSTGSLGQGLPIALGIAMADKNKKTWCLISDGESTEGSVYEAMQIQTKYRAYNLKVYCNYNGYGAYDEIKKLDIHGVIMINTSEHWFIKRYGQEAHYKALNTKEYEEIIRQRFA